MLIKKDLLSIYASAISAVEGKHVVAEALPSILEKQFSVDDVNRLQIIAIGKAADSMLQGVFSSLNKLVEKPTPSLLISKAGHISPEFKHNPVIHCIESAHPVPDEISLLAGQELIDFLQSSSAPCLFLISGGTSSLVEVLADDWDLKELQELTQWMLANAYSIDQMNAVRSRASLIKGGGLWSFIKNRKVICLMISDVPEDDISVIGSGMLFPTPFFRAIPDSLPEKWRNKLSPSTKINPPDSFYWRIVGSNTQARQAASDKAEALGYKILVMRDLLEGDTVEAAKQCVKIAKENVSTIILWGAETTVILPDNPGQGGRNQHFSLAAAIEISRCYLDDNTKDDCVLLSAGTDGTDGMTDDAGAIVDSGTIERGRAEGFSAEQSLQQANSGQFLYASGDLISTGVTGTNVMDLVIAICKEAVNEKQDKQ